MGKPVYAENTIANDICDLVELENVRACNPLVKGQCTSDELLDSNDKYLMYDD